MNDKNFSNGRPLYKGRPLLYSNRLQEFSSLESKLRGDQIFSGDQPDDFAIAGLMGESPKILMLGAGVGSGIRGIIAANPSSAVTAVDNSAGQIAVLKSVFSEYFPEIEFNTVHADAQNLSKTTLPKNQFDVVCVDLYAGSDYAEFVTSDYWWNTIRDSYLAPQGKVVANSWGLPTHMNPLQSNKVQASMYRSMVNSFGEVGVHSFRRNLTYVSVTSAPTKGFSHNSWSNLEELDQLWLRFIQIRFANPYVPPQSVFSNKGNHKSHEQSSKKHIDFLMHHEWQKALDSNRTVLDVLQNCIDTSDFPEKMLTALSSTAKPARDLLPNQWSVAEIQSGEAPELFVHLTQKLARQLDQTDRQWYVDVWITQLISVALKSSAAFKLESTYQNLMEILRTEIATLEALKK